MSRLSNIIRGRQARNRGSSFENTLHGEFLRHGWTVTKIPLGAKQIGANKLIRVKTDFDFVFAKEGKAMFIDAKITKAKAYGCAAVTDHQINKLYDFEKQGFTAGYIICFSELKTTVFYRASQLRQLRDRSSLKPEDGVCIGNDRIIQPGRIMDKPDYSEKTTCPII
jgi:penicillin-binding protein-related factor A (putative recombinase)